MTSRAAAYLFTALAIGGIGAAAAFAGKPPPPPPPPPPPADPAIAYTTGSELKVMNADGTNRTLVFAFPVPPRRGKPSPAPNIQDPEWSPSGSHLIFHSNNAGGNIYAVAIGGTGLTTLAASNWGEPAWSPVLVPGPIGRSQFRIVYPRTPSGYSTTDLYVVNPDGTDPDRLTDTPGVGEESPTWSPSGGKIAYAMYRSDGATNKRTVGIYDFMTGVSTEVPPGGGLAGLQLLKVKWFKNDENRLLVRSSDGIQQDVWVLDLDNLENPVRLTSTTISERWPSSSPGDLQIAFHTYENGMEVMNRDGTGRHSISTEGTRPAWRRN